MNANRQKFQWALNYAQHRLCLFDPMGHDENSWREAFGGWCLLDGWERISTGHALCRALAKEFLIGGDGINGRWAELAKIIEKLLGAEK